MNIRLAGVTDLPAIQNCARLAYAHYIDRIGSEPAPMVADFASQVIHSQINVIEEHGALCGFIVFYPRGTHLHIENVAISPKCQGEGLGRALLEFAEAKARGEGLKTIELYTNELMTENLEFYPRLGYVETERRVQDGFTRVYFRKEI